MWNPKSSPSESGRHVSTAKGDERNLEKSDMKQDVTLGDKGEIENLSGGVDSGFLSGPQLSYDSENFDLEQRPPLEPGLKPVAKIPKISINKESEAEYIDSGCLEDIDIGTSVKQASGHMLLDSDVDSGLTEWFCNLSLKNSNQPVNNLGSDKSNSKKSSDYNISTKNNATKDKPKNAWEIYYQQNEDGDTQLHLACITGYVEVILALIRISPHPCLLDIQNDEAQSALHIAVLTGQPQIVRILLIAGAEVTIRDRNGNTPLHLACIAGDLECVKALTIPISASEMQEARRLSIIRWTESSCLRFAQLPPDLEQRNYDGERYVHLAAQGSFIDVLRHLIWFGADINAREGKSGRTPLHIGIENYNEDLVNFLLEECQKLNLEVETYAGLTAYQFAVITENRQMQTYLERRGAEPLTAPESDDESDLEYDDPQIFDRFGDPGYFVSSYSGSKSINVM